MHETNTTFLAATLWRYGAALLLAAFLFPAPDVLATASNRCNVVATCGTCCSMDGYNPCCNIRGGASASLAPAWEGVVDSLATAWAVSPDEVIARYSKAQFDVIQRVTVEGQAAGWTQEVLQRRIEEDIEALEVEVLGRPLRTLVQPACTAPEEGAGAALEAAAPEAPAAAKGAGPGALRWIVLLAGLVVARWAAAGLRSLRTA